MGKRLQPVLCFVFLLTLCICLPVQADGGDDLRSKAQNPVSSMYSLPLKFTADFNAPNGSAYIMNVNPVIPVTVGDWNFISRALIPAVVSVDGYIEGTPEIPRDSPDNDRNTGIGDINYSLYISPAKSAKMIWGLGPSITMPTASNDSLGSGKWSAGGAGVVLFQPKWGTGMEYHIYLPVSFPKIDRWIEFGNTDESNYLKCVPIVFKETRIKTQ